MCGVGLTKSFDIDKYNSRECQVHNHGFYLGQQSKQAEVDELQKRIDDALEAFDDGSFNYCRKILKGNTNDH